MSRHLHRLHRRNEAKWAARVATALTTDDVWRVFERRMPPVVGEYFRGGADAETTLRGNVIAFQQEQMTAYGARKFGSLDLRTTVAGHELAVPFFAAPVGSLRSLWPKAEVIAARLTGELGTVMTLSTLTGTPMEEVTAAAPGKCWFQLYLCGGRQVAERGIARAKKAGFTALMLTIDTGVAGNRVVHARMNPTAALGSFRGLSVRRRLSLLQEKLRIVPQMMRHPSWLLSHWYDGGFMEFVNIHLDEEGTPMPYADIGVQLASSAVTWDDIPWIRRAWGDGPLIIKGIHDAEDARRAEACGAVAAIWSNHGGRQQDRVPPTLHIVQNEMPKLKDCKLDFMMDGGIRNGGDVFIALAHGMKAVGLGRVTAVGLGAAGYSGIKRAYHIIKAELERSMRLVGMQSVEEIRACGAQLRRESRLIGDSHLPRFVF